MPQSSNSLKQYKSVDVEARVNSASPHQLIQMLFDKFLSEIALARVSMERNETGKKAAHISKAHSIIEALQVSLNTESATEISQNLESLYIYVGDRLLEANSHNDVAKLIEAEGLIQQIRSGWKGIGTQADRSSGKGGHSGGTSGLGSVSIGA